MKQIEKYEFWFLVGSQFLYGPETLRKVEEHAQLMTEEMNKKLPYKLIYKLTMKTVDEITNVIKEANYDDNCAGIVVWMHTFSPSKMWINGLKLLQKPYAQLHTQFNRNIPDAEIDMSFMNLNQSAHGDREHAFIAARMRIARKVIVGYWEDEDTLDEAGAWMRSAVGAAVSRQLKVVRFGDNMREVAVTEGDKVEAQIKLGWQVNTWPVGDLVAVMNKVSESQTDELMGIYQSEYAMATTDINAVRYQAKEEIAIRTVLDREGAGAFSNTFQDLHGMEQLPGLASQHLMALGYGYAGEGDWKIAALTHVVKKMSRGMSGGTSFIEDYTYDMAPEKELSLGAHMLEVCPSIAEDKPRIEIHSLNIGDREPPARLVFEGSAGEAIIMTLIDMGGRLRLIVHEIETIKPPYKMPNLPVARIMWKPKPNFKIGTKAWLLAGGAHHGVLTHAVTAQMMKDWANIMGIEFVHINRDTVVDNLETQLFLNDLAWKLK